MKRLTILIATLLPIAAAIYLMSVAIAIVIGVYLRQLTFQAWRKW